jgi:hypothetical protein
MEKMKKNPNKMILIVYFSLLTLLSVCLYYFWNIPKVAGVIGFTIVVLVISSVLIIPGLGKN